LARILIGQDHGSNSSFLRIWNSWGANISRSRMESAVFMKEPNLMVRLSKIAASFKEGK